MSSSVKASPPLPPLSDFDVLITDLFFWAVIVILMAGAWCGLRGWSRKNGQSNGGDDDSRIASVTFAYKPGETSGESCSICLDDFKLGDECRVLVVCNHVYHKACIDLWLSRDNHCPLCRGSIRGGSVRNLDDQLV